MNIQRRHLIYLLIAIVDMALILGAYFLASFVYLGDPLAPEQLVNIRVLSWRDSGILFLVIYAFFLVLGYAATRVFGSIYFGQIRKMAKSVFVVNLIGVVLFMSSFYVFNLDDASRILVLLFFVFSTLFVCTANWVAIHLFRLHRNSQNYRRNVLVVGRGHLAEEYAKAVAERSSRPEHVIGYIDPNLNPCQPFDVNASQRKFLGSCFGSIWNIEFAFQSYQIDEIVLALDVEDYACVSQAMAAADRHGVSLTLVPFYNDIIPRKPNIESFGGINLVDLRSMPLSNPFYELIKRACDIVVSLFVIIITSWLMVITAIGVKLSSPGPVLFRQLRIGKDNKPFEILKFRSMRVAPDSNPRDPSNEYSRKTQFGSFIRKYSIDELPQFFNVLKGDMSIVGPRPLMASQVREYSENISYYMLRHQVRPGITGLAQISGFRGDTLESKRIECDIYYIQHWSFWLDVKIFFKTLFGGFANDEALSEGAVATKLSKTKFWRLCNFVYESASEGNLAKAFNCVYLCCVFLYVFVLIYVNPARQVLPIISQSFVDAVLTIVPLALLITGAIVALCEARKLTFWCTAVACWFLFSYITARSDFSQLMMLYLFVFAYPKTLRIDLVAGIVFLASALSILLIVGSSLAGVIPDYVGSRFEATRHSMGFISANAFATAVTACLIPYVYFRLSDWRWFDAALCLVVGVAVYYVARGRMAFLMLLFLVVLACICRFSRVKKILSSVAPWIFVGCFFVSLFVTFMYWQGPETSFSNTVNQLFSGRFKYISYYYDHYTVKIFGQKVTTVPAAAVILDPTKSWLGIDGSYVNILLRFGIVGSALLILPTIWLGAKARKDNYTSAVFVMAVIALFSMTENFFYNPVQNFGIFIMGYFIAAWATKRPLSPERASAPIEREVDWVNMKGSRWQDFLSD